MTTASTDPSPLDTSTGADPSPRGQTPPSAKVPAPLRLFRAALEWIVRYGTIRDARQRDKDLPPHRRDLFERARSAWQAARETHEPSGPLANAPADAVALEFCRQSVHWALCHHEACSGAGSAPEDARVVPLATLWKRCDPNLLLRAAGDASSLSMVEQTLARSSFVDLAELPQREQRELVPRVLRFTQNLIALLDAPQNVVAQARAERTRRLAMMLVVVVSALVGLVLLARSNEESVDLARGKAWKASSSMGGCQSPKQSCGESGTYFFHTVEEANPWVEIDLGSPQTVSAVRLLNRKDCCPDRAIPLVVELSDDRQKWREVGRRTASFMDLRLDFREQRARYVRVRALRKTWLHLRGVRVLP